MNYESHPDYPKLLAANDEIRRVAERSRSRLSDVIHYATHNQWDDVKTALDEIGDNKRQLNDLYRRGATLDQSMRRDVQASAGEKPPKAQPVPEPDPEEDPEPIPRDA